ncbi:MAG: pyruvate dehydrogenase [Anaerolineae bacterium UTCFX2]|jgi:2-oxoisovalerate dehydrogenase E1 component|nr:pyruvate dehydrogenase [Anaerolineae bacterium]MCZ7551620.1 thiamine pyrophosphate-dependent enzyme [Anaerolineales bacterium]OQY88869.1 MAG: pyruvate dehydrogenase [Anaerolineae bacterium UTCFX2]
MTLEQVDWWKAARLVMLSRQIDALEVNQLTPQGKVNYQFSAGGHELGQVLLGMALDHPHDAATAYYRSRPLMLASGLRPVEALAAGMGLSGSPSQGRDAGVMFNLPRRTGPTILPASGNVGSQYTPALGWAQAIRYRERTLMEQGWQGALAAATGGEASTAANGFWAALNAAATLELPLLFFIENNCYGLSVPASLQTPGGSVSANLACYSGLKVLSGDGTDPQEAWELVRQAVEHVRRGAGPCLLELFVVRLAGHTFIDDQAYKPPAEQAEEKQRDPFQRLKDYLDDAPKWEKLENEAAREVEAALQEAEALPVADTASIRRYLFFEGEPPQQGGLRPENALLPAGASQPQPSGPRINMVDAVRQTLEAELKRNPRMLVFGEDVGVKGGVHGATLDMQAHFGAERVFDTSLNEDAIIGRSVGLALAGLLPVPEIQFRKYADPAHEQISDLGTLRWRTVNRFAAPAVVRIPVGFGKKIGDPWHSLSAEAVFAHLPGWRIAYPSNAEDAVGLLRTALRGDDPTMFFEHRALLDTPAGRRPYPGDDYCLPFGKAALLLEGDELTLLTWGAMVARSLEAAKAFPGRVRLLDLRTIIPWDQEAVLESTRLTGRVLIVHEDTLTGGFAGEITAVIASQAFTDLDAPIERLGTPDVPIPFSVPLMDAVVPSVERIREKIGELLAF